MSVSEKKCFNLFGLKAAWRVWAVIGYLFASFFWMILFSDNRPASHAPMEIVGAHEIVWYWILNGALGSAYLYIALSVVRALLNKKSVTAVALSVWLCGLYMGFSQAGIELKLDGSAMAGVKPVVTVPEYLKRDIVVGSYVNGIRRFKEEEGEYKNYSDTMRDLYTVYLEARKKNEDFESFKNGVYESIVGTKAPKSKVVSLDL
ncbi:hypothetical protein [Marinobacterium jannaschii]|uniref:hypothetical protein n=1 Tax=Marinobacterium jannaschii TaxID=64970 RepID=UPI0004825E5E|nr:hypothetical protein [Marinobacterium jannaschii]